MDCNFNHDPPYFVMPLAAESLETELTQRAGDLPWVFQVFQQVCLGVQALHQAGVVHRDLKPANVLHMDDNRHVVADLGTAKREPRDSTILTRTSAVLGTLSYLAPEQLMPGGSRQADARTDIYQLGKMLYQLLTGRSPAIVEPEGLPRGLAHVVRRATTVRPDERYSEVAAMLQAVELCGESADPRALLPGSSTRVEILEELKPLTQPGPLRHQNADAILEVLAGLDQLGDDDVIEVFDRLPVQALAALGRHAGGRLLAPLRAYGRSLERVCGRREFPYADLVARRMSALIAASPSPEITARALEVILIAAVVLNRYSAMSVVKHVLYQIKGLDSALAVAEILHERRDYFQEIAPHLLPERLHPILRGLINDLDWIETVTF
jgi:hypothetical protein